MRFHHTLFLLILVLITPFAGFSQNKKPKVALVLSGGGAKGLAHIPLLQTLDSLGIVPDLVVGNSMGSVMGALCSGVFRGQHRKNRPYGQLGLPYGRRYRF
jgi:NTE family protein